MPAPLSNPGVTTFPISQPSVSGTDVTVDYFLRQPRMIARIIQDWREGDFLIGDLLLGDAGTAPSGAAIYFQVTGLDDQYTQGNVKPVAPGAQFPIVGTTSTVPLVAKAEKSGAKMQVTREAQSRNDLQKFRNDLTAMYNTARLYSDTRTLAAVNAAPILTQAVGTTWATTATANIRADLETARYTLQNSKLGKTEGYVANTLLLGTTAALNLRLNTGLTDFIYKTMGREAGDQIRGGGSLDGLLGFNRVRENPFIGVNDVKVFDGGRAGGKVTEYPLELETWYERETQSTWFQLSASDAFFVSHPKAILNITGA